ncbi:MAG: hypothetical protein M1818_005034 [Claussenomyces sp. TS43310]|nr:MAG: hypothetical protein M1818_005034 [Claussenomyces sp. TS43310]
MPDFRILSSHELPAAMDTGISVTSVCINTAHYLAYLVSQCLKSGCNIKRAVLSHIVDAASLHSSGSPADIIINCTGLLASRLGGVMDDTVIPARGQIVVVRNSPNTVLAPSGLIISVSGTDDADDEACYIMQRAAGGGTVLGGTYQPGRWESQPDADTSVRIMKRAVEICPELVGKDAEGRQRGIESLSIVRQGVGLRPLRKDGVRIEKEKIGESWVVHNYGHAGWGYQGSYGCSEQVVELVEEVLGTKAKL